MARGILKVRQVPNVSELLTLLLVKLLLLQHGVSLSAPQVVGASQRRG
jgi:hypothetical protein